MECKMYFDRVANDWDEMRKGFYSEAVRNTALSTARVKPGETAADIGAGSGFITEGLVSRGLKVIAVDQSESMLEVMRRKFAAILGIEYRKGDGNLLPIADGTVHHVFANMYLHHVESPGKAIKEMARVLRPGGKMVITDLDEHDFLFLKTEHHDRWMGFTREEVRLWMVEAGLRNPIVVTVGQNCCARSSSGGTAAQVGIFVASAVKGEP